MTQLDGGSIIGEVLAGRGVKFLFTLCGGHISPILVGAKQRGIKVVDVRDEKNAVFAADAVARMSGIPGVAAVTAGPGVTNTITAVKTAQMAESPIVIFGGAAATITRGRGSLQDIDQMSLMKPITKWATSVSKVASLRPTVERAFDVAQSGVPGPVFVEVPIDLLYGEDLVREMFMKETGAANAKDLAGKAIGLYLKGHLYRQFHAPHFKVMQGGPSIRTPQPETTSKQVAEVAELLRKAERPALVIGSQALVSRDDPDQLATAVNTLGMPTFLGGMARGLLGQRSEIQLRHKRGVALKGADLVIIAGFPFDFRLGYGRSITSKCTLVAANLSPTALRKNRRPEVAVEMHPGDFIRELATIAGSGEGRWNDWFTKLKGHESARNAEIDEQAKAESEMINPLHFFQRLETKMDENSVLVVDGGDFVATCSYILRPRRPLCWLDPGVFGTLGVGGGFTVGAALSKPDHETWLIYGDGSSAYSLSEFDTCVRHGLAPIAVIGSDGAWAQIAREQTEILNDDVGTVLLRSDYQRVAEGYGGVGLLLTDPAKIDETLDEAKRIAKEGKPVCINVHISATDFRKGSISM